MPYGTSLVSLDGASNYVLFNSGNVGIGTTSPGAKLDVAGDLLISSGEYLSWGTAGVTSIEGSTVSNKLQFKTNSTDRMIINDTGVGIGTTSPSAKLQVNEYTVASQGNQNIHGELSVFTNSGDESLFLGIKNAAYPNRGWAFNPVISGVNSDLQIKEHGVSGVRMTIKSGGNVGIGTTSPDCKLDVRKSGTTAAQGDTDLFIGDSGAASSTAQVQILGGASGFSNLYFSDTGSYNVGGFIYNHTDNYLATNVNGSEKMRITSAGNVGIGTTTPLAKLDVNSNISASSVDVIKISQNTNGAIKAAASLGLSIQNGGEATNAADLWFTTATNGSLAERLRIKSDGNVGIGTTSPQATLDVNGPIRVGNAATTAATANNVGAIRYRDTGTSNYLEMVLRTGTNSYAWTVIKEVQYSF